MKRTADWLWVQVGWLLLTSTGHTWAHWSTFADRASVGGAHGEAFTMMRAIIDTDSIFEPSLMTLLQMLSLSFTAFLLFMAVILATLARANLRPSQATSITFELAILWGMFLLAVLFLYPVINTVVIASGACLLSLIAHWRARGGLQRPEEVASDQD